MKTIIHEWLRRRGLARWTPDEDSEPAAADRVDAYASFVDEDLVQCATCPASLPTAELVYRDRRMRAAGIGQCTGCVAANRLIARWVEAPHARIIAPVPRHRSSALRPGDAGRHTYQVTFDRIGDTVRMETGDGHITHPSLRLQVDEDYPDPPIVQLREQVARYACQFLSTPPTVWFFPYGFEESLDGLDGCDGSLLNARGHCVGRFAVTEVQAVPE